MTIPRYKWQPTTAEIAAEAGISVDDVIRFDHNTTPGPTTWASDIAAATAAKSNEYPGASYMELRRAASRRHGLAPDYFVPGAGADELILLAARAFLGPGSRSAAATPTYPLYRIACAQVGIELDEVPTAGPGFALDEDSLVAAARDADLLWLCLPNNPTGAELDSTAVDAVIAATDGVVVIDAAYAEFVGADWAPWVDRYSNLIVLHTLSKAYGLAAARVGYAMAHPALIDRFDALRPPGSIATVSAALGVHALDHPDLAAHVVAAVAESRSGLAAGLSELGMRVVPSRVNFLLCEVGPNAVDLAARLRARGLIARTFNSASPLQNYLRFTVRSPDENGVLLAALREEMS